MVGQQIKYLKKIYIQINLTTSVIFCKDIILNVFFIRPDPIKTRLHVLDSDKQSKLPKTIQMQFNSSTITGSSTFQTQKKIYLLSVNQKFIVSAF